LNSIDNRSNEDNKKFIKSQGFKIIIFFAVMIIIIISLHLINYFIDFGWNLANSISVFVCFVSILGIFYNNYKNDNRLIQQIGNSNKELFLNFNYECMKKRSLKLKNSLKEIIKKYGDSNDEYQFNPPFNFDRMNRLAYGYIKLKDEKDEDNISKILEHIYPQEDIVPIRQLMLEKISEDWKILYSDVGDEESIPNEPCFEFHPNSFFILIDTIRNLNNESFFDMLPENIKEDISELQNFTENFINNEYAFVEGFDKATKIINKIKLLIRKLNMDYINKSIISDVKMLKNYIMEGFE
jgi:uncharacterized membrane protein